MPRFGAPAIAALLLAVSASADAADGGFTAVADEECQVVSLLQSSSELKKSSRSALQPAQHKWDSIPQYSLNDGHAVDIIGFGTYRIPPGPETYDAVKTALEVGYRMFDTAKVYGNEHDVGAAILDSGIPRDQIFIATKVFNDDHGYEQALKAGRLSNLTLGLGYIDLLLIHSPLGPWPFAESQGKIVETYDALLQLKEEGVVRSVGVSNFGVAHLAALAQYCRPAPAVNQFEIHPLNYNERSALVEYCRSHNILIQAYGSILSGHTELMALVNATAQAHNRTSAQVLLRWALDQGFQVLPKSTHVEYMKENIDVLDFSLTEAERNQMNSLPATLDEYWNPMLIPVDVGDVGLPPASCPA